MNTGRLHHGRICSQNYKIALRNMCFFILSNSGSLNHTFLCCLLTLPCDGISLHVMCLYDCCPVSGVDQSSSAGVTSVAVSQYSAEPHIYPVTGQPHGPTGFMPDASAQPYMQQVVQHIVAADPHRPASAAVYQPTAPPDALMYQQLPAEQQQSALVLQQHDASAAPTHFVLPTPAPPAMSAPAAFGPPPPSQQFLVGQPAPVDRFSGQAIPPPPPPPPPQPYPAIPPCVSGMNTASAAVSYWMTLH